MKIEKVYIGGWFQRTSLQLSEVYDFIREASSPLDLDKKKLLKLHEELDIVNTTYSVEGLEYLLLETSTNINIKIFEDGLIVLNKGNISTEEVQKDLDALATYYETKLSPTLSYLFSLGAPLPKELANIKTVYPYFIVLKDRTKEDIDSLVGVTEKEKYFEFSNDAYDIVRGDKYYFINSKKSTLEQVERYVEEQIFLREFKGQLHRYLNLHRIIWEKIADVKENAKIKGKDIVKFNNKIDGYSKTINLIDTRISQMGAYLRTREKIAKNDSDLTETLALIGYRYETLGNTLSYIQQLWGMTKNYVSSAKTLFKELNAEITQKSVSDLTIVTSMGVGASLIGLFTDSAPTFTTFGVIYFFILAIIGFSVNKVMRTVSKNRKYEINDIEYDKNIK